MDSNSKIIVVTGFGPFRQHTVNPSWEAVKELKKLGLSNNIELHTIELPVSYKKAKEKVIGIWETLKPQLAVHVGLAPSSKFIVLEQYGKNRGYKDRDVCGYCPEDGCCMPDGPERIASTINMKSLSRKLSETGIEAIYCTDAGRYLCDYVYYISLYHGNRKAAFIHVPVLTKSLTVDRLAMILKTIIQEMLDHQEELVHRTKQSSVKKKT
ncbi:pyroglutamyl-peptidase 1 isoform X2 [Latimeria chalumnae]|uniref:Pyroglutamyl-peptidase I like n=1 Tax=Latimeria chalumnae TaxID=7897 RepID=H3AJ62_LATCH|nr:PREDICTED: pyroglutamyl-peptidase 1-like [Latimeria chalumnae]XP_006004168.1 PREDICTED: pyroglutamyl-peptidase 1-like [Latimeria chalumnae]XP_006004169.1 PREDICTED: pyroglutamyl-peptidase 1-like [Latimeria chalumnae]XP_014348822.1 PREDICTED: pyroglutamyl-peptidase 1-like [Latimeria chalumnae]|eukprot:XP_006004166.1 PREDICTED: pyroglutamyl-peptidase 1-like [Latimeria chalumnae]